MINPNYMVVGSKNVLTNVFRRVGSRRGYSLDGQRGTANSGNGIYGSFDWKTHLGTERNLRIGDGTLQVRYVASAGDIYKAQTFTAGQIYWIDAKTSLGDSFSADTFWDFSNELKDLMLFVDGTSNIYMWSGAISTIVSTSWATGSVSVLSATPTAGGSGYVVGDVLTITTGGTGATATVTAIGALGTVTAVSLTTPGSGYTTGAGKVTSGGTGTSCTLDITTVAQGYIRLEGQAEGQGFLASGTYTQSVNINSSAYTYSKCVGEYLVGISADPTGESVQSVVLQTVVTTANSAITTLPDTFKNYILATLNNQVYVSASDDNSVYISKANSFTDFSFTTPVRKISEGAILTLDAVPTAMRQQGNSMLLSAGEDYWYATQFQLSSDNQYESLTVLPIKTTAKQAARVGLSTRVKNLIAFVSFETQINTLGVAPNYFGDPQVVDISYPIVNDVQAMDFAGGDIKYLDKYLFVTAPAEGKMLIFNMTQDIVDENLVPSATHYWEAPQTLPFAKLSIIGGELYGHAANEINTFKLFTGLSDDGKPYRCVALMAYDTYGDRASTKSSDQFFIEGYKYQDTELTGLLRRNLNGPVASWKFKTLPNRCIIPPIDDVSIGKIPIGKSPIGGTLEDLPSTPPKFRLIQTYNKVPFFEEQPGFSSEGVGQWWEIVSFSTNAVNTLEQQTSIKDPNEGDIN